MHLWLTISKFTNNIYRENNNLQTETMWYLFFDSWCTSFSNKTEDVN